jgi:hypothetical protein
VVTIYCTSQALTDENIIFFSSDPAYYLSSFVFPANYNPNSIANFNVRTHIDCFFSGEIFDDSEGKVAFSRSTTPIVEVHEGVDLVICLSPAFKDYQGTVSVSVRWNALEQEHGRETTWEQAFKETLDYAFIYYSTGL